MTTLAAMREAMAALGPATEPAAPTPFAQLPPTNAEHGPRAARRVAQALADTGHHSHLVAYGETICLTGTCTAGLDALRGLL